MRVLLINPPSFNLYTHMGAAMPPLGLAYMAAVLKESGHSPEILDLDVSARKVDLSSYDLVGISALTPTYPQALGIAQACKREGVPVAMGGYHPTFMDEETLKTGWVDYVVRGEGEYVLLDLLDYLEGRKSMDKVNGVSYRKNGEVGRNPAAIPVHDLDSLPLPARDLLELDRYDATLNESRMTSVITSRGCPFNCYFCSSSRFGGKRWRSRSPGSILNELGGLKERYNYQSVNFIDDNFTLNPRRTVEICEGMIDRKLGLSWLALSRPETIVKHEAMVEKMAEAGAYMVFLGMESASEETLRGYRKVIGTEQFQRAVSILAKYNIKTWASFMIGALNETRDMIIKTLQFARKLNPHAVQFSILTPYPGTDLFERVKERLLTRNWNVFDGTHPIFRLDYMSAKELRRLLSAAYRSFYLRPAKVWKEFELAVRNRRIMKTLIKVFSKGLRMNLFLRSD